MESDAIPSDSTSDAIQSGPPALTPSPQSTDSTSEKLIASMSAVALTLAVGSFLPIWMTWYFGEICTHGVNGTLWSAIGQLPGNAAALGSPSELIRWHFPNLATASALVGVAVAVGYFVSRRFASIES
jgi:hypothetical protein